MLLYAIYLNERCHASGNGFLFFQDNQVKSKFWGKSIELIPFGSCNVVLTNSDTSFTWNKVDSCMRNIFSKTRYIEHYGTMQIDSSFGFKAEIVFKESTYFSSSNNEVNGNVFDENGIIVATLMYELI